MDVRSEVSFTKEVRVSDASPQARLVEDFCQFLAVEHGCVLKAWRHKLDPGGYGTLNFTEFAEALTRIRWHGDVSALWTALLKQDSRPQGHSIIGLFEISPSDEACVCNFRRWATATFGGAVDMFKKITADKPSPALSYEEFSHTCDANGFQGNVHKLFHEALDIDSQGDISMKDMAFLEEDAFKRKVATDINFVVTLESAKAQAKNVRRRNRRLHRTQEAAVNDFRQRVRNTAGGSFIRGWRRFLDSTGNLCVSKMDLLKGCKRVAFDGDPNTLWKGLDTDDSGAIELHEVEPKMAMALARFKRWAVAELGSCADALQKLGSCQEKDKRSPVKMSVDDFASALRLANFPGVPGMPDKQTTAMLHEAMDVLGVGAIHGKDAAFLERWDPAPWLCTDPDLPQRDHFISLLRQRYGNLLVAWRRLDRDNSNRVSYKEFAQACKDLRFSNLNLTGIWTALDTQTSGFISLRELDKESADVLTGFKDWAEGKFGTMQFAFKVMDEKRANALSYPRFRKALQDYGYNGDAKMLFQSLKPEKSGVKRSKDVKLHPEDLLHLSMWTASDPQSASADSDDEPEGEKAQPTQTLVRERRSSTKCSKSSSSGALRLERARRSDAGQSPQAALEDAESERRDILPKISKTASMPALRRDSTQSDVIAFCTSATEFTAYGSATVPGQGSEWRRRRRPSAADLWRVGQPPGDLARPTQPSRADLSPYRLPSVFGAKGRLATEYKLMRQKSSLMEVPPLEEVDETEEAEDHSRAGAEDHDTSPLAVAQDLQEVEIQLDNFLADLAGLKTW